jgi:hypothetical protein
MIISTIILIINLMHFLRVIVNNIDFLLKGIDAINKVKIS